MKRSAYILFFTFILISSGYSQQFWTKKTPPTSMNLKMVAYSDTNKIWVCGDSGTVLHSTNGGNNWTLQATRVLENIHYIYFLNERLGWALSWLTTAPPYGTRILKTTNGGLNWSNYVYATENVFLNTIVFLDSLEGWLGGYPGGIQHSTDGGINWTQASTDSNAVAGFPVKSFTFYNKRLGFACGGFMDLAGVVWRTTNFGAKWSSLGVSPEPLVKMAITDSLHIFGVGGDFEFGPGLVKSNNGGTNWSYKTFALFGIPSTIAFRTNSECWVPIPALRRFLFSTDTLESWSEIATPDSINVTDIVFINYRNGYCIGDTGSLYKFNPNATSVNNFNTEIPTSYNLFQNYPNPFNPSTKIKYQIPFSGVVKISVFDVLGREIYVLLNQYTQAGTNETQWNAANFSSGIYFYRITVNEYTSSKTMMLLK